jgi:hypothetical protein
MSRLTRTRAVHGAVLATGLACCVIAVALVVLGACTLVGVRAGAGTWLTATVLTVLAVPLARPRLDRVADRVAFGPDGDPYAVMNRYVRQVSEALAIDDVLPHLARTAAAAVPGSRGEAALELADGTLRRQSWPPGSDDLRPDLNVPLLHAGDRVGKIAVETGAPHVSALDRSAVERLAGPAGLALANLRLTLELRRRLAEETALSEQVGLSRQRLLDAASDQRRRFAAAVAERVESRLQEADAALGTGAQEVEPGWAAARAAVQQALDTLRDLASGVFPPALTDRGVVDALETYVDRHALRVAVNADASSRDSAPVEAAAYFCVATLLDDPAGSRASIVSVVQDGDALVLTVAGPCRPSGSTIQLARDRAQALGGTLDEPELGDVWQAVVRIPRRPSPAAGVRP